MEENKISNIGELLHDLPLKEKTIIRRLEKLGNKLNGFKAARKFNEILLLSLSDRLPT